MALDANYAYTKGKALKVLHSQEHQTAQRIVRMYHNGVRIPEICQKLGIDQQRVNEVLL